MRKNCIDPKLNNKGLSLVELIIAISIGVIISGTIAALITFSMRLYHNESVNVSTQYELQTNINMMMDEIMASSTVVVVQNASGEPHTKYAMFGNPNSTVAGEGGAEQPAFKGVLFVPSNADDNGRFRIYMKPVEEAFSGSDDVDDIASAQYDASFSRFDTADHDPNADSDLVEYLLGENATVFDIQVDPNGHCLTVETEKPTPDPDTWIDKYYYSNPIEVGVKLKFIKDGWGSRKYEKQVDDTAYMRNRVKGTIYVDGQEYKLHKK